MRVSSFFALNRELLRFAKLAGSLAGFFFELLAEIIDITETAEFRDLGYRQFPGRKKLFGLGNFSGNQVLIGRDVETFPEKILEPPLADTAKFRSLLQAVFFLKMQIHIVLSLLDPVHGRMIFAMDLLEAGKKPIKVAETTGGTGTVEPELPFDALHDPKNLVSVMDL